MTRKLAKHRGRASPRPGSGAVASLVDSPLLFALFIHYNLRKGEDWERYNGRIELKPQGRDRLKTDIKSILPLLDPAKDGWKGFAFIFLDLAWKELVELEGIELASLAASLERLKAALLPWEKGRPVRLITARDLIDLVDHLQQPPGGGTVPRRHRLRRAEIERRLIGPGGNLRYDSAKAIEAVVRIANFSRNVPLLRFDDDVIFPRTRASRTKKSMARTRHSILALCERYHELALHPDIHTFVFSGSYLDPKLAPAFAPGPAGRRRAQARRAGPALKGIARARLVDTALNGFATRVVMLANLAPLEMVDGLHAGAKNYLARLKKRTWIAPGDKRENLDLVKVRCFLNGLCETGANAHRQVTSGAGLCLSDSAILDLPPFSNMSQNVMWIDDHLKFSLHHELRHFGLPPSAGARKATGSAPPAIGRVDAAWFQQQRHLTGVTLADVRWHTRQYLPRLLRGMIADSWLRADPRVKLPASGFSARLWKKITKQAGFTRHFIESLRRNVGKPSVGPDLRETALRRLIEVRDEWCGRAYTGTYLHLVTVGRQDPYLEVFDRWQELGFLSKFFPKGLVAAVDALEAGKRSPLDPLIRSLIKDFLAYVELVRFWKTFVQSTRFLLNERREEVFWPFPVPR